MALAPLVAVAEAGLIAAGSLGCRTVFNDVTGKSLALDATCGIAIVSAFLYLAIARSFRLYETADLIAVDLRRVATICGVVVLLLAANLFALKAGADIPRGYIVLHAAMLVVVTGLTRLGVAALLPGLMADCIVAGRPSVLIGAADELDRLSPRDLFRQFGFSEVARVIIPPERSHDDLGCDVLAAEAIQIARWCRAEAFVLAVPWVAVDQLDRLERRLRLSPLPVQLLPDSGVRALLARQGGGARQRGAPPILQMIDLHRAPLGTVERAGKRALDIATATATLILLSPLLLGAALLVKLDTPGPVFFHQRRTGFNQRTFVIHKFRTMRVLEDSPGLRQAQRHDERTTRVGRMLRRTSIDELPQLLNVLKGEMSIVGPRPHAIAHDEHYQQLIGDYCLRHHVKPGITGWAQVNGLRGETRDTERMSRRVELDIWYVSNWSFALDLWIILRTAFEVMSHDAY